MLVKLSNSTKSDQIFTKAKQLKMFTKHSRLLKSFLAVILKRLMAILDNKLMKP